MSMGNLAFFLFCGTVMQNNTNMKKIITALFSWVGRWFADDYESALTAQDQKNLEYVMRIVEGQHTPLSKEQQTTTRKALERWFRLQRELLKSLSREMIERRTLQVQNRGWTQMEALFSDHAPTRGERIVEDAFTEPFPSSLDMDDWALTTQTFHLFTLQGIRMEDTSNYYIHVKSHHVNHSMKESIIQFDMYRLE